MISSLLGVQLTSKQSPPKSSLFPTTHSFLFPTLLPNHTPTNHKIYKLLNNQIDTKNSQRPNSIFFIFSTNLFLVFLTFYPPKKTTMLLPLPLSLVFPTLLTSPSSPYKFIFPTSFGASENRTFKAKHRLKPLCAAKLPIPTKLRGFGRRRKMDVSSQAKALEEGDAILGDGSLDSSSVLSSSYKSFEAAVNKSSKWLVAGLFGSMVLWKHDAEVLWAATGAISNAYFSIILKRILNHERPSGLRSDPGMPSSHAQSIFYIAVFALLSLFQSFGVSALTVTLGMAILACGSYFSWLRVSQQLHTTNQVLVGAILGTIVSITWFWLWHAFLYNVFVSSIWVRIVVVLGSISLCTGFVIYVFRNWLDDERI